jgi:poly(3-hydroxybutyrate) depolymerase
VRKRRSMFAALTCAAVCSLPRIADAALTEKTGTFAGATVTYEVVTPAGFDSTRAYPVVLVFGGGPQTQRMARTEAERWRPEAERRGYIIVSPATPDGSLFFEAADRIFPSFIEMILHDYKVAGKIHISGLSNGGISAFHVAARYPQYFSTLTGYPGLLDGLDARLASAIKPMCIFMHVGDRDTGWRSAMEGQSKELAAKGFSVRFGVEKNEDHVIRAADLAARMFDEIESCRR